MNNRRSNESSNLIMKLLISIIVLGIIASILVPTLNGLRIEQERRNAIITYNQVLDRALDYAVDYNITTQFTIETIVQQGYLVSNPFNKGNVTFIFRTNGIIEIINPKGELEINGHVVYVVP